MDMTGAQIKELFRLVADVTHSGMGGSGTGAWGMVSKEVRYTIEYPILPEGATYFPRPKNEYYHGVIKEGTLKLNGQDFVDGQTYRVLTTHYLAEGQDGYVVFVTGPSMTQSAPTIYAWRAVAGYIYEEAELITPYLDGRVTLIGGVPLD
jgi:hypothetical protein